jgi:hypothetical protein
VRAVPKDPALIDAQDALGDAVRKVKEYTDYGKDAGGFWRDLETAVSGVLACGGTEADVREARALLRNR